jgi:hypothetical protein
MNDDQRATMIGTVSGFDENVSIRDNALLGSQVGGSRLEKYNSCGRKPR